MLVFITFTRRKIFLRYLQFATLPQDGYDSFIEMCRKYETGILKEQRATAKELRGKPTLKPSYIKCLFGIDVPDRVSLLSKV